MTTSGDLNMSDKNRIQKHDLVKYSERAMTMQSFSDDWYEDIPGEISNDMMVVIQPEGANKVLVYSSDKEDVVELYLEDITKVQE